MSKIDFTDEQKQVINVRDKEVLVSAAAGSGKTAVLVKRIISIISQPEPEVNIDQMVVVTFTNAAAEEIKQRIMDAIEELAIENPDNEHIQKQRTYIHNASISTIHSFCNNLIKEHCEELDLDPAYRIADDTEIQLLQSDIINEMLEKYYSEAKPEYENIVEAFTSNSDDLDLEKIIVDMYKFLTGFPFYEDAIEKHKELHSYDCIKDNEIVKTVLIKIKNKAIEKCIQIQESIDTNELNEGLCEVWKQELTRLKEISELTDVQRIYESICGFEYKTLRKSKANPEEMVLKMRIPRNQGKKLMKGIKEIYDAAFISDKKSNELYDALINIVTDFKERFHNQKVEKKLIDYGDMEEYAIKLLVDYDHESKTYTYTELAKQLSRQYYEIMIDEYQDSNLIQEMILTAISKNTYGEGHNMFMVGDVKQSIYSFRRAKPELFLDKIKRFNESTDNKSEVITLSKNFRSRNEIVDSTNTVFEKIMTSYTENPDYNEMHRLKCKAKYCEVPQNQDNTTEVCIINTYNEDGINTLKKEKNDLEASYIAQRVEELIERKFQVQDKATGQLRPIRYSDIVILSRVGKQNIKNYAEAIMNRNIPCIYQEEGGFFETYEISTILNMLMIIDNPLQNIAYIGVLKSPFVGLSNDDIALIRANDKKSYVHLLVESYINTGNVDAISNKLSTFIDRYNKLKKMSTYMSMIDTIDNLLEMFGITRYITAMSNGTRRKSNIEILRQKADSYDKGSYSGLFNFIRYIEKLKGKLIDYNESNANNVDDNCVRIMTIHKSKGMEFPVVILAGACNNFRLSSKEKIHTNANMGIGLQNIDIVERVASKSALEIIIDYLNRMEIIGEEIRILYVAMTRAKEKLIIVGTDDYGNGCEDNAQTQEDDTDSQDIMDTKNYMDMLLMSNIENSKCFNKYYINPVEIMDYQIKYYLKDNIEEEKQLQLIKGNKNKNEVIAEKLEKQIGFVYQYNTNINIHSKYSVSELKHDAMEQLFEEDEKETIHLYDNNNDDEAVPEFMKETKEVKATTLGTAYHRIFELLDYSKPINSIAIEKILPQLDIEDTKNIKPEDFIKFAESSIGKRMANAYLEGTLQREQQFVIEVGADSIDSKFPSDEKVLVQGVIDACFLEAGEYVIVDYKTDRVQSAEQLVDRYRVQLEYYQKALEQITNKKVKQKIIYAVRLGEEIIL